MLKKINSIFGEVGLWENGFQNLKQMQWHLFPVLKAGNWALHLLRCFWWFKRDHNFDLENNGWASNIFWIPIHYDTIKDGQKKISSFILILSWNWVIFAFYWRICQKCYYKFTSFHLNNYTPYENKCFNPRNQIHRVAFVMRVNSVCVQVRHAR